MSVRFIGVLVGRGKCEHIANGEWNRTLCGKKWTDTCPAYKRMCKVCYRRMHEIAMRYK